MTATATLPPTAPLGDRAKCQRCPATVVWVKTESRGRSMPLDPKPHPDGNVIMIPVPQSRHFVAKVLSKGQRPDPGVPAYRPHFVTCRGGRPNRHPDRPSSDCQLCPWSVTGKTKAEVRRAFTAHYAAEHLDRCPGCNQPVTWIRTRGDMQLLTLESTPVPGGDVRLVPGGGQLLAVPVDPEDLLESATPGYRIHNCHKEVDN